MRKLRGISLLLAAVCFLAAAVPARAESESAPAQVTDQAEILSSYEERQLANMVEEVELTTNWDVMVVTVADAGGESAGQVAEDWVNAHTVSDNGVICLVDMDNRELYLSAFGEAIYYLTDERREEILDSAYYEATDGDYDKAVEQMLTGVSDALQRGIPDNQYTYDEETRETVYYDSKGRRITLWEFLLAVAAGLAAGGITIGVIVGKYRLKFGGYQYSCRECGHVELDTSRDTFVNQIVTHRRIPKSPPPGSGSGSRSGRSSVHSSGGRKFSGSGRKF